MMVKYPLVGGGVKYNVIMSGELTVGEATQAESFGAIMWNEQLYYYFGDDALINSGSAGARTYGPRSGVFQTMTVRKNSIAPGEPRYQTILADIHSQSSAGGSTGNYFMRFMSDLEVGDRILFDGINYWTSPIS
jgi:hypothetical protein